MPDKKFLKTIRSQCSKYGIVMIMDEVKTGSLHRQRRRAEHSSPGRSGDLRQSAGQRLPGRAIGGKREIDDG